MRKKLILWASVLVLSVLAAASVAVADDEQDWEDDEAPIYEPRADSVSLLDGAVVIPRPTGWNVAEVGKGAVAVFRSATDERARIEVRMSTGISERRWERYWRSFDTELRQAGFDAYQGRTSRRFGSRQGLIYEYELSRSESENYRLVVWHTHESDRAWVFTIFFAENRRDAYLPTFHEMLNEVTWP